MKIKDFMNLGRWPLSRIKGIFLRLESNYWFIPSMMISAVVLISFGTIALDQFVDFREGIPGLAAFTRDAEGARSILQTVAGSMITVAVTAFSITIVALQLASTQLGPRVIRSFMKDRGSQATLGVFLSTFIYALLVLRSVQEDPGEFVPHISVIVSLLFAVIGIGVLVYFINHIADSIQAENVIAVIGGELDRSVDRLFPEQVGRAEDEKEEIPPPVPPDTAPAIIVKSKKEGYLQAVYVDRLKRLAEEQDMLIFIHHQPGDFVIRDSVLLFGFARKSPEPGALDSVFRLGRQRTEEQDVEFTIAQLVQIGARALSPSLNDPFTAMRCIHQLSAALCRLARRKFPSGVWYDHAGRPRLVTRTRSFEEFLSSAFTNLCTYGRTHKDVLIALLHGLQAIGRSADSHKVRYLLLKHAHHVFEASKSLTQESDLAEVRVCYQATIDGIQSH